MEQIAAAADRACHAPIAFHERTEGSEIVMTRSADTVRAERIIGNFLVIKKHPQAADADGQDVQEGK